MADLGNGPLAGAAASPAALAAFLLSYPREHLEALTEALIAAQDVQDGDPDLEPNGDERDGTNAEDEDCGHSGSLLGPGCPLSDPGEEADDSGQCDEDGINTNLAAAWGGGPGCIIADPDAEHDGREEERGF